MYGTSQFMKPFYAVVPHGSHLPKEKQAQSGEELAEGCTALNKPTLWQASLSVPLKSIPPQKLFIFSQ